MDSATTFRTPYDVRIELVRDAITSNSPLDVDTAADLAEHVLRALRSVPENMR